MKKRIIPAVLITALLCGCGAPANPTESGEATTPVQLVPSETGAETLPPDAPEGAAALKTEEIASLQELFGSPDTGTGLRNFYHMALTSQYDSPDSVHVHALFGSGFGDRQDHYLSENARKYLSENSMLNLELETLYLPQNRMNEILERFFGVSLADVRKGNVSGFNDLVYYEGENAYFCTAVDAAFLKDVRVTHGWRNLDGTVEMFYTFGGSHPGHAVLSPTEDGFYQMISKVWPGWKQPIPLMPTPPTEDLKLK